MTMKVLVCIKSLPAVAGRITLSGDARAIDTKHLGFAIGPHEVKVVAADKLPVTTWAEQSGHYVNLEGRVQEAHAALQPVDGVRSNAEALQAVAQALGYHFLDSGAVVNGLPWRVWCAEHGCSVAEKPEAA